MLSRARHRLVLVTPRTQSGPTALVVSPYFPPSTLAGVHRARHLAKHLPSHGWRPIIVSVDERYYAESTDPALAALVPLTVDRVRTKAVPAALTRLIGVGDLGLRSYLYLASAIDDAVKRYDPKVVLITGSPFYPLLLAHSIKRRHGIPVVLDFQDPWVSSEGQTRAFWSKGGAAHRLAVGLEPHAVRHARFITSVSDTQNDEMATRYPWLDASRMAAIPIGGDPEDFDAMRSETVTHPLFVLDTEKINISYVGTFLPRAVSLVRQVFRAVSLVRQLQPRLASRLCFNFVGTSNQPDGDAPGRIMPIAIEEGIGDLVREYPRRVPFLEALGVLGRSDGLILIGSDEPHYTASKIYPALMSRKPFVSLFHVDSSAHSILEESRGGRALCFSNATDLSTLTMPIAAAISELATNPSGFSPADPKTYAQYTADAVAAQFARVFDGISQPR